MDTGSNKERLAPEENREGTLDKILDLSHELRPGERRRDGRYLHGDPFHEQPVEVQDTRQ